MGKFFKEIKIKVPFSEIHGRLKAWLNVSSKTATKDIKWGLDFAVLLLALNMRGLFSTILKVPTSPSHPEYPTSPEGLVPAFLIIGSVTFLWQLGKVPSLKLTARS